MIPTIAIVGFSKTGKTTIMEFLISNLTTEGYEIGAIKHVHNPRHSLDVKGKDSWRHSQAGAKIVVCASPKEIALFKKRKNQSESIEEILELFKQESLDLLLIEGYSSIVNHRADIPKIVVVKNEKELNVALKDTQAPILAFLGPFQLKERMPRDSTAPFLSFKEGKNKLLELIREFLSQENN